MTNHDAERAAKIEYLRERQRRTQEALAKVRGKGYGLNAAVVVELDASGELVRLEITDAASRYNMESIASGVRRAFKEARQNAQQQIAQAMNELGTDPDVSGAVREIQEYFGIEPVEGAISRRPPDLESEPSTSPGQVQGVEAFVLVSSANISLGFFQSSILRGRSLISAATAAR